MVGASPAFSSPGAHSLLGKEGTESAVAEQDADHALCQFLRWVLPRWDYFWKRFKADGTMTWHELQHFVDDESINMKNRFAGNLQLAFKALEDGAGNITTRRALEARRQYEYTDELKPTGLEGLKRILISQHRTLTRAWRALLDPQNTGRCCQAEFVKISKAIGFTGDLKSTWRTLTRGEVMRTIAYGDLDPDGDRLLASFATALAQRFSSLRDGWMWVLKHAGRTHRIGVQKFMRACGELNISDAKAKRIFLLLDRSTPSSQVLVEDDLEFLSMWGPKPPAPDPKRTKPAAAAGPSAAGSPRALVPAAEEPLEFVVVLTAEEYQEYRRRLEAAEAASTQGTRKTSLHDAGSSQASMAPSSPVEVDYEESSWAALTGQSALQMSSQAVAF